MAGDKKLSELLRFGTRNHQFCLDQILQRFYYSQTKMNERHEKWRRDDESFLSYMPVRDADQKRANLKDAGSPQYTTIYIPYDYAVLMSAHTYWTSVFLSRSPVFQFQGQNATSQSAEQGVESIIDYQLFAGRMLPPLYIWLMDVGKYGVGIVGDYWQKDQIIVSREVDVPDTFLDVPLGSTHKEIKHVAVPGYEGNKLYNVRPTDFFPDPRVTMDRFQEGEFCGRLTQMGWNALVKGGAQGRYFNLDIARSNRGMHTLGRDYGSPVVTRPYQPGDLQGTSGRGDSAQDMSHIEILEMYIELIPSEWRLSDSTFPEKWVFVVANGNVVIHAQPLGLFHNKWPFAVIEMEPDGYTMFKRSILELSKPMNDVITWLINTHFYNTRKALNDMFIVDPSKVVMKDVLDPKPGKVIRLKEELYGTDVRSAISQLQVTNVTQAHLQDSSLVANLLQRVTGVNDNIMGMLAVGGRKTATEVRTSSSFGINRLKTSAEWFSCTGFADLSMLLLQHTQQLMQADKQVRIAGADAWTVPGAERFLTVSPQDIQGLYDFVPVDGTLPIDRYAQVNMWASLLQQMANAPQVLMQYDLGKIFGFIAQLGGIKNISQFRIQMGSPEQLQQQAAAGNVIPLGAKGGKGRNVRGANGAPGGGGAAPNPAQAAGMGPSG